MDGLQRAHLPDSLRSALAIIAQEPALRELLPESLSGFSPETSSKSSTRIIDSNASGGNNLLDLPEEWGCAIVCGGVIGNGILATVSFGATTPGMILGAAGCGSCMGFIWGSPPTEQSVDLGPGTGGHVGSILPPLPPGWVWDCVANSGGGYTCTAEELGDLDPY